MYLLFMFQDFYPQGGWNDYIGKADTITKIYSLIYAQCKKDYYNQYNIVSLDSLEIIEYGVLKHGSDTGLLIQRVG